MTDDRHPSRGVKPSVGRIVHHRAYPDAECNAAIVTVVKPANDEAGLPERVGLVVFRVSILGETTGFEIAQDVREGADRGWHWPERVD